MSFKLKIFILVLLSTLPLIVFILSLTYREFHSSQTAKLTQLETITQLVAAEHKQVTEGARQLLIAIASTPAFRSPASPSCSAFLASLRSQYVRYVNFGVVDSSGHVLCAADLTLAVNNPPSSTLINQTLASHNFTLGSYYQIKEDDGAVINFGYPLSSTQMVYASLSLEWVSDFVSTLPTPPELVINILDQHGTVLARRPEISTALGQNFATDSLIQQIIYDNRGTTVRAGIDRVTRLYAFSSIGEDQKTFIAAGLPQSTIYADIQSTLITSIFALILVTTIAAGIALKIGDILIVKQVESLQAIDKLKDEFVSLASHQLRSPMTAIRWLSESLLESKSNLTRNQQTIITKIHTTTLRLIHLTSSLLNISRLESGTLTPHLKVMTLSDIMDPILTELRPMFRRSVIHLKVQIPHNTTISTDPNLLSEIIRVILDNSLKYSPRNSQVEIKARTSNARILIYVKDHGIGIPIEAQTHLFTRFYRADNARLYSPNGNGLGLYLAHLITTKLDGTLTWKSLPGKSTTLTLTLPNKV